MGSVRAGSQNVYWERVTQRENIAQSSGKQSGASLSPSFSSFFLFLSPFSSFFPPFGVQSVFGVRSVPSPGPALRHAKAVALGLESGGSIGALELY